MNDYEQYRRLVLNEMLTLGPDHFAMDSWFSSTDPETGDFLEDLNLNEIMKIPGGLQTCGTTGCWAGTALSAAVRGGFDVDLDSADHGDIVHSIAKWMNVPEEFFFMAHWMPAMKERVVELKTTGAAESHEHAEWMTVVEWLKGEFPNDCYPEFNPTLR